MFELVENIAPQVQVIIKWPNDILSNEGSKLSGILLERSGDAVVIGFGLNLACHPHGLDRAVTDLVTMGARPPKPQDAVEILATIFSSWLRRWREGGISEILDVWQERAHPLGTALSVSLPSGERLDGHYSGLCQDGALRLCLADGSIHAIHAADIFLI